MNAALLLVPLGLFASLTLFFERLRVPPEEPEEVVVIDEGYGFVGLVAFMVAVSALTLLALYLVG
jgi:hypothetical protein